MFLRFREILETLSLGPLKMILSLHLLNLVAFLKTMAMKWRRCLSKDVLEQIRYGFVQLAQWELMLQPWANKAVLNVNQISSALWHLIVVCWLLKLYA